jgi:hypothetical protein
MLTSEDVGQVVTTEVPVYVDKLVVNEVVKEVEKIVTKEVVPVDEEPIIEFKSEKTKSQRSGISCHSNNHSRR